MKKFLLDTNILMRSPNAMNNFGDNEVYICDTTLRELDNLKTKPGETGFNAREAIRRIYQLQEGKAEIEGISLANGGCFSVVEDSDDYSILADDRIINKAFEINATLVTSDVAMYLKAKSAKCPVEMYTHEAASESTLAYTGKREIYALPSLINALYKDKECVPPEEYFEDDGLLANIHNNEYVIIKSSESTSQSALARYYDGKLKLVDRNLLNNVYGVKPRNVSQVCALDALLAPVEEIPLVILNGPAGTAKTFLSMAAGLQLVKDKKFMRMLILRPNIKFDEDIGYLKGDEMDKITPLIRPCLDNLEALITPTIEASQYSRSKVEKLFAEGTIEAEALAYARGRSIANTFVVVDEAQNSTPRQMLGILTRASLGSKMVITGDPEQIDNPKVDKKNNGLVYAAEKMIDSKCCAQIGFGIDECVRSPLAQEAAELLAL